MIIAIKDDIKAEFERVESIVQQRNPDLYPIYDGILDQASYSASRYKCCFMLKEPYDYFDEETVSGGGWSFSEVIDVLSQREGRRDSTVSRCAAIAYSINHDFCETDDLTKDQIVDGLKACCWINLSKTPARSATTVNSGYIEEVELWSPLVRLQLLDANPDIIVFGNTFDLPYHEYPYQEMGGSSKTYYDENGRWYAELTKTIEGKIQVNTYHPSRKGPEYESMIVNGVKDFICHK